MIVANADVIFDGGFQVRRGFKNVSKKVVENQLISLMFARPDCDLLSRFTGEYFSPAPRKATINGFGLAKMGTCH